MTRTRTIRKVFKSQPTIEGAGVHLKRAFGFREVTAFDPFLLFDDFRSDIPEYYLKGFPWHPHRGIETITYVLDGMVEHGDSMGNKGVIGAGDVQWMTAGSGIIHQEMPQGNPAGVMGGFQLWANLPASHKMMAPRYQEFKSASIPAVVLDNGVTIKLICGQIGGQQGPVENVVISPEYLDITLPENTEFAHPTPQGHTAIAYVIAGQGYFCREKKPFTYEVAGSNYFDMKQEPYLDNETLVLFGDGDEVFVSTTDESVRLLLFSGKPIKEPIAWYGPIVMNTQEELRIAFEEYQKGTFIKDKG
jgi:redox-sensitive bicupin YhaK (pirin superfamily)